MNNSMSPVADATGESNSTVPGRIATGKVRVEVASRRFSFTMIGSMPGETDSKGPPGQFAGRVSTHVISANAILGHRSKPAQSARAARDDAL